MNRKIVAIYLSFIIVLGIIIITPNVIAEHIVTNIKTHHREGSFPSYFYPTDDFFREENDIYNESSGYDNVFFSFFATDEGNPYVGDLWVEIKNPSGLTVYWKMVTLSSGDSGTYTSWSDNYYWDVPITPEVGTYHLHIWNTTEIIGTHTFWVYEPSLWTATINLYEDPAYTNSTTNFPIHSSIYYKVHIEDENGGPLYYYYEYEHAHAYVVHDITENLVDSLELDFNGDVFDDFFLNKNDYEEGNYTLKIKYPSGIYIPNSTNFTVYLPLYTVLKEGWNLISVPLVQSFTSLSSVLDSIQYEYDSIQWYDGHDLNDFWKHHKIAKPFGNDLFELNETMGFWIHITQPGETIFMINGTQPTVNQTIPLHPGWNMVGYPSLTSYNRTVGLNNLTFDTHVDSIWTYNASTQKWKELGPSDYFEIGRGYWVHAKVECEWEVPL